MQDQKNAPKVTRYGFRKLSFGLASVALGSLLMMGPAPIAVNAAEGDVATELAAEDTFSLTFMLKNENGEFEQIFQNGFEGYTKEEFLEMANAKAEETSKFNGQYSSAAVGNDYTFYFEGLEETPAPEVL